jgi:ATP phosphoribosyltransferase regulatory subunit
VQAQLTDERSREVLLAVPRLRGGIKVLDRARELTESPQALAAIDNLQSIWNALILHSVEDCLQIDLGLLLSQHYYTGTIFEGYAPHVGFPICSGGRYDELLGKFGRHAAATGFVIGIERLLDVLEKTEPKQVDTRYVLFYEDGDRYPTIGFAAYLRSKRFTVTSQRVDNVEEAMQAPRPANVTAIGFKEHKLIGQDKLFQAMFTDFGHSFSL